MLYIADTRAQIDLIMFHSADTHTVKPNDFALERRRTRSLEGAQTRQSDREGKKKERKKERKKKKKEDKATDRQ